MHGDEIDVFGKLRMLEPDVPGFGGRHRLRRTGELLAGHIEIHTELLDTEIVAQKHLVADDQAVHVAIVPRRCDRGAELAHVVGVVSRQPRTGGDLQVVQFCERNDRRIVERAIGADAGGAARQQQQVGADLL